MKHCFWLIWVLATSGFLIPRTVDAAVIDVVLGGCTLRDAIRAANADAPRGDCPAGSGIDTIRIQSGLTTLLESPLPTITTTLTIEPVSGTALIQPDDGESVRPIMEVSGSDVVLNNLELRRGSTCVIGATGGAGLRAFNAMVEINNSAFVNHFNCQGPGGGAIRAENSMLTIRDSLFQDNVVFTNSDPLLGVNGNGIDLFLKDSNALILRTAFETPSMVYYATPDSSSVYLDDSDLILRDSAYRTSIAFVPSIGGPPISVPVEDFLRLENASTAELTNTTVLSNRFGANLGPGTSMDLTNATFAATLKSAGDVDVTNSIIEHCQFSGQGGIGLDLTNWFQDASCTGAATPGNLFLLTLSDRGGPTESMALHWLSDAINAGSNGPCPAADQRGVLRDGSCDIGAFERVDMADIQVSAVINQAPPYYEGQPLSFDVNVFNDGPNVANGIQLDLGFDNLAVQTIDGICETNPCTIESLLPGAGFETITVSAQPINLAAVDFELTASASNAPVSIYQEIDLSNNSSSAMGTLGSAADLAIEKTLLSPPPYSMGQAIEYEIVVENLGPDLASDVVVVDSPEGLTINNISNCSNPPAGPCGFTGLADGNQLSLMVSATISSERFNNQVLVVSSSFDPNPANDIDERGNGGNTESDSDLKTSVVNATSGPYYNGKVLNYTVGVANLGPDTATDVEIDLQFANSFPLGISGDCNVIPCIVPSIAEGAGATVSLQLSVGNSLDNVGLIAVVSSNQTDTDLTNNIDGDSYSVIEASDVGVTLTPVSSPPYFQGSPVQYELRVFNLGFDYADDVVVDLITQNLTIQSALSDSCVSLPCTIPTLGLAQTEVMEIIVLPDNIGPFGLSASADALQYDPIPANNVDNTNNNGVADIDPSILIFRDSLESP